MRGEILELKNTINTMVDQLDSFAVEVTRVAREVGTEGKLGGQAEVRGVAGTWKDLTDNVNVDGRELDRAGARHRERRHRRRQRRPRAQARRSTRKGEIAALADTINDMIDTLATFAEQVTERGARSRHRRQARRPGRACRAPPACGAT